MKTIQNFFLARSLNLLSEHTQSCDQLKLVGLFLTDLIIPSQGDGRFGLEPELTHLAKKQFELTCIQVIKTQTLLEKQVLRILGLRYFP